MLIRSRREQEKADWEVKRVAACLYSVRGIGT